MLPTLSLIKAWDTDHLSRAATYWSNTAESWENTFDQVAREMQAPGGTPWFGGAAQAAQRRAHADRLTARNAAGDLRTAAAVASAAVADLAAAKKRVLMTIGAAEAEGFVVGEDLSVTSRNTEPLFPAEYYARKAQADSYAALVRERALALAELDVEVASRLTSAIVGLESITFSSPPQDTAEDPLVQLVDNRTFKEGPMYPEPGIEPGSGGPGPVANAEAIREAIKHLPRGTKSKILEVRDANQLRQFVEWAKRGAQEYRPATPYRGGETIYRLPDGTFVSQGISVKHGPTMDIKLPDGSGYKIHVNDKTGGDINMPRGVASEPARPPRVGIPEPMLRPPLAGPPQLVSPGGAGPEPSVLPAVPPLINRPEP